MPVVLPPAYEGTGYRRVILEDGTMLKGRAALELPPGMTATDEEATPTRPARTRVDLVGLVSGILKLLVSDAIPGLAFLNPADPANPFLVLDLNGSSIDLAGCPVLIISQTAAPTGALPGKLRVWWDGTNIKTLEPDGTTVKTITRT